jgi:hypothetical protein
MGYNTITKVIFSTISTTTQNTSNMRRYATVAHYAESDLMPHDNLLKYLDLIFWNTDNQLEGLLYQDIAIRPPYAQKYARKLLRECA